MFVFNSLHSNLKLSYNIVDNLVYCDFLSIENDHTLFKNVESQNPGSLGFRCRNSGSKLYLARSGGFVPDEPASGGPAFRSAITQRTIIIASYCGWHQSL